MISYALFVNDKSDCYIKKQTKQNKIKSREVNTQLAGCRKSDARTSQGILRIITSMVCYNLIYISF